MPRAKLKQRPDGRYACRFQGQFFYGKTETEAFEARDEYKALIKAGLQADKAGITVQEYSRKWITVHKAHVTDKTYDYYALQLERINQSIGQKRMMSVTTSDIQEMYNTLIGKSESAIHLFGITIRGMFKSALSDRVITHNPCDAAKLPKGTKGSHRAIEEWERDLILSTEHRLRPAVMTMLYAGLRRGEAMAINIDRDVDFQNNTITVREAIRFEGNKPVIVSPKTKAGIRTIPMMVILGDILRDMHGLLLPAASGNHCSDIAFKRAWKSYMTALSESHNGFTKRWPKKDDKGDPLPFVEISIQPHDLRHSYCTMLYDAGVDIKSAMKWMGHADQAMTMRIYTHLSDIREQAAKEALAEWEKKTPGSQNGSQLALAKSTPVDI